MQTDITRALTAIRERAEKATPGPWTHRIDDSWSFPDRIIEAPDMVVIRDEKCNQYWKDGRDEHNFDFIAASRSDVPALLDCLEVAVVAMESVKDEPYDYVRWKISNAMAHIAQRLRRQA